MAPDRPIPSPTLPLPLLPSGPDGVYGLVARGDRRGPPARIVAKIQCLVGRIAGQKPTCIGIIANSLRWKRIHPSLGSAQSAAR